MALARSAIPMNNEPIMLMSERFPRLWRWGQGLFFVLPLLPTWGALGLFILAVILIQKYPQEVLKRPLSWGLMALSLWLMITAVTAAYPQEAWLGIANFIPFFIVFAGFNLFIQTPSQLRRLAVLGVSSGVIVAILGIGQVTLGWRTPEGLQGLLGWVLVATGNPYGRLASVFMYANIAGAYLVVMFTLALGLWVESYRWRRRELWRIFGLSVVVLILAVGLVLTSSRNAWGVALVVSITFMIYLRWKELLALGGMMVALVVGAAFAPSPVGVGLRQVVPRYFWARLNDQMYLDRASETLRTTQWQFTWEMIQQRPFFGWGLRNFTPLYQEQMGLWLGHPHNFPLMLSAEIGLPGALLLLILVSYAIIQGAVVLTVWCYATPTPGAQQWQKDHLIFFTGIVAFCALSLFNLLDVTVFDLRTNLLAWLLLAVIYGINHHHRKLVLATALMR